MPRSSAHAELERALERVIHEHLEQFHRAAHRAVERSLSGVAPRPARHRSSRREGRRTESELQTIADALFAIVCAHPGSRMATLASRLGSTTKALQAPMRRLKASGRVRSTGHRHLTRYFPLSEADAAAAAAAAE